MTKDNQQIPKIPKCFKEQSQTCLKKIKKIESLRKEIEILSKKGAMKKNQTEILELKNTITKFKNNEWAQSPIMEKTEEIISKLENRTMENTQCK